MPWLPTLVLSLFRSSDRSPHHREVQGCCGHFPADWTGFGVGYGRLGERRGGAGFLWLCLWRSLIIHLRAEQEVAEAQFQQVFRHYDLPEDIVSDSGLQFTSRVWKAFMEKLGVTFSLTSGYRPQSNGQVERMNQELGRFFRRWPGSIPGWGTPRIYTATPPPGRPPSSVSWDNHPWLHGPRARPTLLRQTSSSEGAGGAGGLRLPYSILVIVSGSPPEPSALSAL
ncbi:uncharacterized protein [Salmo salar]|uniref:Integrase catalytic domain-containing protein n=1 Tax=Salmo salar TaxID=8030 RepID=A0ABM3DYB1_SALSA|nr:uncharacterized protein LOC123730549 [Salmo salar]